MSDLELRRLQRLYDLGDTTISRQLVKEYFRLGAVTHQELIPRLGELEIYRIALNWPEMSEQNLAEFHAYVERAHGVVDYRFEIVDTTTRLGYSPFDEASPLFPYVRNWQVNPPDSTYSSLQIDLSFSKETGFEYIADYQRI